MLMFSDYSFCDMQFSFQVVIYWEQIDNTADANYT